MPEKPTILERKTVAKSRLFCIEALDLRFSNGAERQFERLTRGTLGSAVLIVPLLDEQTVLLVREYSAGVDRYELGLPKGKTEPEEPMLEAAERELKEEVGYGARDLFKLARFSVAPGYLEHETEIILARNLYADKLPGDEPEDLEVVPWRLDEINALIATGECTEARSIAALFMTNEYLKNATT